MNRKLLTILLGISLAVGLGACGSQKTGDTTTESDAEETEPVELVQTPLTEDATAILSGDIEVYYGGEPIQITTWYEYGTPYYALYDINSDGAAELLVKSWGDWINIICYRNDRYEVADSPFYTGATGETILTDNRIIMEDSNHPDRHAFEVYQLDGDCRFQYVQGFSHWYSDSGDTYYAQDEDEGQQTELSRQDYESLRDSYLALKNLDFEWLPVPGLDLADYNITCTDNVEQVMSLEDKLETTGIKPDFEGTVGSYSLSADRQDCQLNRAISGDDSAIYQMLSNDTVLFEAEFGGTVPNGVETAACRDINGDGIAEILLNYYVESTGGYVLTQSMAFSSADGDNWTQLDIVAPDGSLATAAIADLLGSQEEPYTGSYVVRDVVLNDSGFDYLADYGALLYALRMQYYQGEISYSCSASLAEQCWPFDYEYSE